MNGTNMNILNHQEFGSIRVIDDHGKLLFCGSDVAGALNYKNRSKALSDHCRCVTKRYIPHPQSQSRSLEMSFIPEGDVYRLIAHSHLPAAERFERWIFDEVLPTIRKTGGYMTQELLDRTKEDPTILFRFANMLVNQEKTIREMTPKADYYDTFIHQEDCTNIRSTAKELRIGERNFCKMLIQEHLLYRAQSGYLLPYAEPFRKGLFIVKDLIENGHFCQQTVITPKGKNYIRLLIEKRYEHLRLDEKTEWKDGNMCP